jgi:hypothetical protein
VQQKHVTGSGAFAAGGFLRGRVLFHWKLEKLPLGCPAERTRHSSVEEPNDGLENPIRCVGVSSVNAEDSPVDTEHHGPIGVGDDTIDVPEPEFLKPGRKEILE